MLVVLSDDVDWEHIFEKSVEIGKEGCVKHEGHKENCTWHTKFTKLHVCCIQSFLLMGSWMRKVQRTQARVRFLIGDRSA